MKNKRKKWLRGTSSDLYDSKTQSIRFSISKTDSIFPFLICSYFSLSLYFPLEKILGHDFFPLGEKATFLSSVSWYYKTHAMSKEKISVFDLRIRVDILTVILTHAAYVQSRLAWLEKGSYGLVSSLFRPRETMQIHSFKGQSPGY